VADPLLGLPRFVLSTAISWLRSSTLIGDFASDNVLDLARDARGADRYGHRAEFLRLVELSASLKR
jgi:Ca-activated chloride channel family protein